MEIIFSMKVLYTIYIWYIYVWYMIFKNDLVINHILKIHKKV